MCKGKKRAVCRQVQRQVEVQSNIFFFAQFFAKSITIVRCPVCRSSAAETPKWCGHCGFFAMVAEVGNEDEASDAKFATK